MIKSAEAKKLVDSFFSTHHERTSPAADFPTAVRAELRRMMNSRAFDASERNRRFLEYVIEETLAGRAERIKAYSIATDVFGRDTDFDPMLDPVVRMEARRLRRSLERFYLLDVSESFVRIAMPKGNYVPEFQTGRAKGGLPELEGSQPHDLSIVVAEFDLEDFSEKGQAKFADAFARQLTVRLSQFPELKFSVSCLLPRCITQSASVLQGADLVLSGNIVILPKTWTGNAVLLNARSGRVVWAETFEGYATGAGRIGERNEVIDSMVQGLVDCIARCDSNAESGKRALAALEIVP